MGDGTVKAGDTLKVRLGDGRIEGVAYVGPGHCRRGRVGCRRPFLWALTAQGHRMPLDLEPDPEGVYTPHWRTCPKQEQFYEGRRTR